jgi:hypothetical protein
MKLPLSARSNNSRVPVVLAAAVSLTGLAIHPASAATYTPIAPYSAPGTTTGVNGINDAGFMTGVIGNADGSSLGFLRDPTGVYTTFAVSGPNGFDTYGRAINNSNVITGYSTDGTGVLTTDTEFKRDPSGVLTVLTNPTDGTLLHGIAGGSNSSGMIVGDYTYVSGGLHYRHGYLIDGASFTDISAEAPNTDKTEARAVTDSGTVVGFELNAVTGVTRGFVDIGGVFQFVSDPNPLNADTTYLESINNAGLASGEWVDAGGTLHPFIFNTVTDVFSDLTPPTPDSYFAFGINNLGQVVLAGQASGLNYLYSPTMGVPEPATWVMTLFGFGGLGGALRSRRRRDEASLRAA